MILLLRSCNFLLSLIFLILSATMTLMLIVIVAVLFIYSNIARDLPDLQTIRELRLQVPLRIYSADERLMAEIGEKRRIPLRLEQIPPQLIKTILVTEDERFFEHHGVDGQGLMRAIVKLMNTGEKIQGGSTITMQLARNFYLSPEKSYQRKFKEILLALGIERILTKEEILELYLNKIYFGNRAYGVGAAAWTYYGLAVNELSLAQIATLAGIPKAPSRNNPIANPLRATIRRDYVLNRLLTTGEIDETTYKNAINSPETARLHGPEIEVNAPYLVEMVRANLVDIYGEDAYTIGLRVYTTLNPTLQRAADTALRGGILDYEERHGYRGAEGYLKNPDQVEKFLANYPILAQLPVGRVTEVYKRSILVQTRESEKITINWEGLAWARRRLSEKRLGAAPRYAADVVRVGDIIRVRNVDGKWRLAQIPEVSGALVSLNPKNGAILALNGGYDFAQSKFNRALQAERQPGSSFKPFIYSAALDHGYTLASVINDSPLVIDLPGNRDWRPENYGGKYHGPTRLREALIHSLNLVSIRILQAIGINYAIDYITRFGFQRERMPRNLTLALGTLVTSPLEIASAYAIFANGGYRVIPYFIQKVIDENGAIIFQAEPPTVCQICPETVSNRDAEGLPVAPRVVEARNVYLVNLMLQDVVNRGTAARAKQLGRNDLAGKTGTTNAERDTWFCGFNREILATVWIGYDQMNSLGGEETGGRTALPIWINYMNEALRDVPEMPFIEPPGLVTMRINHRTGSLAKGGDSGSIFETFTTENLPPNTITNNPLVTSTPNISSNANNTNSDKANLNYSREHANSHSMPEQLF